MSDKMNEDVGEQKSIDDKQTCEQKFIKDLNHLKSLCVDRQTFASSGFARLFSDNDRTVSLLLQCMEARDLTEFMPHVEKSKQRMHLMIQEWIDHSASQREDQEKIKLRLEALLRDNEDLSKWTVVQLRDLCKSLGLASYGRKDRLIENIQKLRDTV